MQTHKYDCSIIVPVHNREQLIKPCIASINKQTYDKTKWEVIFIDDGSTDKTIQTIQTSIKKEINYRIIKREVASGNASSPRNDGIKASNAKYIFFLDSDDEIDEDLLTNGLNLAFKNNSDIVYVKTNEKSRAFKRPIVDIADIRKDHLLRACKIFKIFKLSVIKKNKIFFNLQFDIFEDMLFVLLAILHSKTISILADKCYYFRLIGDDENPHLTHRAMSVSEQVQIYGIALLELYSVSTDIKTKIKYYNALLMRCLERIAIMYNSDKYLKQDILHSARFIFDIFFIHKEYFDPTQIYKNEKHLVMAFLLGNMDYFFEYIKEYKLAKPLKEIMQQLHKNFSFHQNFKELWVYKGEIVVLDFVFNDNKIAFDFKYNKSNETLLVNMFCRNNKNFFDFLREQTNQNEQNKLCIFNDNINKQDIMINNVKSFLEKIKERLNDI